MASEPAAGETREPIGSWERWEMEVFCPHQETWVWQGTYYSPVNAKKAAARKKAALGHERVRVVRVLREWIA